MSGLPIKLKTPITIKLGAIVCDYKWQNRKNGSKLFFKFIFKIMIAPFGVERIIE